MISWEGPSRFPHFIQPLSGMPEVCIFE